MTGSRIRCNHIAIGQTDNMARIEKGIYLFFLKVFILIFYASTAVHLNGER